MWAPWFATVHVGSLQCAVYSRISIKALEHVCGALSVQSRNHSMLKLFKKWWPYSHPGEKWS